MSTSISVSTRINAFRAMFSTTGAPSVHIDYSLLDSAGNVVGGGTHSLYNTGAMENDPFTTDGKSTAFTTLASPYGGATPTVSLNNNPVTSGFTMTTNANGTVTVTFDAAPAAATTAQPNLIISYPTGPSLTNAAGDIVSVLGLSNQSHGTIYENTGGNIKTSHQSISEFADLIVGWAKARVEKDKLS